MVKLTVYLLIIVTLLSSINMNFLLLIPIILLFLRKRKITPILSQKKKADELLSIDINYILKQIEYNVPIMYSYKSFNELANIGFAKAPIFKVNCLNEKEYEYAKAFIRFIDDIKSKVNVNLVVVTDEKYIKELTKFDYIIDIAKVNMNILALINAFNINLPLNNQKQLEVIQPLGNIEFEFKMEDNYIEYSFYGGILRRYLDYRTNSCLLSFQGVSKDYFSFKFTTKNSLFYVEKTYQGYNIKELYGNEYYYINTNLKYIGASVVRSTLLFVVSEGYMYISTKMTYLNYTKLEADIIKLYSNINSVIIKNNGFEIFNNYLPKRIKELYFINPLEYIFDFKNYIYGYKSLPFDIEKLNTIKLLDKNLSCYYNYIRYDILGIYILHNGVKFIPKINMNLEIELTIEGKVYTAKLVNTGQSVIKLNQTNYHNLKFLSYKMLEEGVVLSF